MNFYFYIILFFTIIFQSCSTLSTGSPKKIPLEKNDQIKKERPLWVESPLDFCGEKYLCSVGEASGKMIAESAARNELAKIFKVKIKSENTVYSDAVSKQDPDGVVSGEVEEEVLGKIKESTEELLEGVEIKETYQDDQSHYALASLNKRKAAKGIASKMDKIDAEVMEYYRDGQRHSLNKAIKRYFIRENLNDKHQFLVDRKIRSKVSFGDLMRKKREKAKLKTKVLLLVKEIGERQELKALLIQNLLENGFRVTTQQADDFQFKISVSLEGEQEYFNVPGFVKYKFLLKIVSRTESGDRKGALTFVYSQNGRDLAQCFEQALPSIRNFIKNKFDELNLD